MNTIQSNISDIKDYANMQQKLVHSITGWKRVRNLIVNKQGDTISMQIKKIDETFDFNFPSSLPSLLQVIEELETKEF